MRTRTQSKNDAEGAQQHASDAQTRKRKNGSDSCPSGDIDVEPRTTRAAARKKQRRLPSIIVVSDDDADPSAAVNDTSDGIEIIAYPGTDQAPENDETRWLPHTQLVRSKSESKGCPLPIRSQSREIQRVITDGLRLARRWFVLGGGDCDWVTRAIKGDLTESFMSPFAFHGADMVYLSAMISVAKENGLTDRGDVVDRLENGSTDYTTPLITFGAVRLRKFCTGFKAAVRHVVYRCLRLNSMTKREVSALIDHSNYIYPAVEKKFDKTKPFESEVLAQAIRAAFFVPKTSQNQGEHSLDLGLVHGDNLISSDRTRRNELEVSPGMLLLAAAAVAAVLNDKLAGGSSEFSGPHYDSLFKEHLVLLATLRKLKPVAYHRLMHGILMKCRSEMPIMSGRSNALLSDVEWDSIVG
ncbi:hypothetical protein CONPUDRAFT_164644 [Coniophora puteana RWD-64-598 SS2]|uniref:DUF6532 domain-containing protein n=1 Tax=Coniophora puteana (strain RWD-64-598) TaxID=741705 RepID=A0A5M3MS56_CONPW|nr:uncharacterized protein CONPUDRAFT_164644 [Coniophora puteana RWD-64-598 SS2]EIW81930.1 hypothetical protein CONPUDRAFT_164644 [Coniophora puteana RWD-64-598 SS2]